MAEATDGGLGALAQFSRDFGKLEAQVTEIQHHNESMKDRMTSLEVKVDRLADLIATAQGGWSMAKIVVWFLTTAGALVMGYLLHAPLSH